MEALCWAEKVGICGFASTGRVISIHLIVCAIPWESPLIVLSLPLLLAAVWVAGLWPFALGMFLVGWAFQFLGHAVEGKPPEFLRDWRFLFVGLRWWIAKMRGRA